MLTVAHVGGGGVKKCQKHAHVINGRPQTCKLKERLHPLKSYLPRIQKVFSPHKDIVTAAIVKTGFSKKMCLAELAIDFYQRGSKW